VGADHRTSGPHEVVTARDDMVSVARGGATNVAGVAANGLLQFLLVVVISRGMGPEGTGVFYQAIALFMILTAAAQFGSDAGVIRMLHLYRASGRSRDVGGMLSVALWTVLGLSTLLAALTFLLAPQLAAVFMRAVPAETAALHIRILTPFLPLATTTLVLLSVTRAFGSMVPTVLVENVGKPALRVVLVLTALAVGAGTVEATVWWALPIAIGAMVASQIVTVMTRRQELHQSGGPSTRPRRELATEFWRFSAPRGLAGILEITLGWLDILILGAFRSPEEVGVYAAVSRTVVAALFVLRATNKAFQPRISELLARDRRQDAQTLYQVATWWLMAASLPIYITLVLFARYLLQVFGAEFSVGHSALALLSLAMLVNVSTGNVNAVLLMGGKSSWNLMNAAGALTINIVLNVLLIPRLGMVGAAIAWGVSIVALNLAAVIQVRALLGLRPFGAGYPIVVVASAVCFGVTGVAAQRFIGSSTPGFIVYVVVSSALYLLILFRLREKVHLPILRQALSKRRHPRPAGASAP
jgi:O-antigen/teichoic acid export membrane protein